uniref:Glutathione S-transferase O1 n=1 Tax=Bemisia tabaci TaxID=7038 RepID=A0A223FQY7_BEMTA|nr:PREDICTED: pyrimidodiazepine synthase-like [Bemisia tabaci]AST11614.1 glutathione S-transferase o1 [Bemisia tabaci]QHU80020.1 glutathione S-transferase O1 [Bemisia tabaci]
MTLVHHKSGSVEPPLIEEKLRLYSMRYCPYAQRVHLVLNAKKVPYDVVYINLVQKPEWFLEKFPAGTVPAMNVKGANLYESLILADFLDEYFPEPRLHSSDPLQKAKDRLLVESFGKIGPHLYKLLMGPDFTEDAFQGVLTMLAKMENELKNRGSNFFSGEKPGMPDYMIWPSFERIDVIAVRYGEKGKLPVQTLPLLTKWISAMKDDYSVKPFYLEPEKHALHLEKRRAGAADAFDIL